MPRVYRRVFRFVQEDVVGREGLEPPTPCASCKCATSCANGPDGSGYHPASGAPLAYEHRLDRTQLQPTWRTAAPVTRSCARSERASSARSSG